MATVHPVVEFEMINCIYHHHVRGTHGTAGPPRSFISDDNSGNLSQAGSASSPAQRQRPHVRARNGQKENKENELATLHLRVQHSSCRSISLLL